MARRPPLRVEILGAERLAGKFRDMPRSALDLMIDPLVKGADAVRNRAIEGINSPPKTGRVYTHRFWTDDQGRVRRGEARTPHQASAPGEYPAADTGNLARSIYAAERIDVESSIDEAAAETQKGVGDGNISAWIEADAEYAAPLEYKEPERGGRPFLRRALSELAEQIHESVARALEGRLGS